MKRYVVVTGYDTPSFSGQVENYLAMGWQLHGGLAVFNGVMYQAVTINV